jgi:hypothetical protein
LCCPLVIALPARLRHCLAFVLPDSIRIVEGKTKAGQGEGEGPEDGERRGDGERAAQQRRGQDDGDAGGTMATAAQSPWGTDQDGWLSFGMLVEFISKSDGSILFFLGQRWSFRSDLFPTMTSEHRSPLIWRSSVTHWRTDSVHSESVKSKTTIAPCASR